MLSLYISQYKFHLLLSKVLLTGACVFGFASQIWATSLQSLPGIGLPGIEKSNKNGISLDPMLRSGVALINKAGRKDLENKF